MEQLNNTVPDINLGNQAVRPSEVMLMLFSPRKIQDQQLHTYHYSFPSGLADYLDQFSDMREAVGRGPNVDHEAIRSSIKPDPNGITLPTDALADKWTFVLFIDEAHRIMTKRHIYSGWFKEEPININTINMSNPALNYNATMMISTSVILNVQNQHNPQGTSNIMSINGSHTIPAETNQLASADLYYLNPGNINRVNYSDQQPGYDNEAGIHFHDLSIANNSNRHNFMSNLTQQSPTHHFRDIVGHIGSARNQIMDAGEGDVEIQGPLHDGPPDREAAYDPRNTFDDYVTQNLSADSNTAVMGQLGSFEPSVPHTLKELTNLFPDIQIYPVRVNPNPQWDQRPQNIVCSQNIYSYMSVQVIEAYALSYGIGNIAFRYSSYANTELGRRQGAWKIENVQMLVQTSQQAIAQAVKGLQQGLENDLFPILLTVAGDFDLMIRYDTSQTLVSLNFMDDPQFNEGVLEFSGAIGGMTVPIIGGQQSVIYNHQSLASLINQIKEKDFPAGMGSIEGYPQAVIDGNEDFYLANDNSLFGDDNITIDEQPDQSNTNQPVNEPEQNIRIFD